jgi:hypothetical protein
MLYIVFLAEISHFVRDDKAFRCFPSDILDGARCTHRVILRCRYRGAICRGAKHGYVLSSGARCTHRVILNGVRSTK